MQIGTMMRFTPGGLGEGGRLMERAAAYARRIEAAGFPAIWVGDSLGRGHPTLDPLMELATLAAVTSKVELGIGVLQLPLRHPIELAHRVQSLQALSNNRLMLGVGSGSTKDDFDLLGYDYDKRFGILRSSLRAMQAVWRRRLGTVGLARLHRRSADHDRSVAQPSLDHIGGEGIPGLDAIRPLQQLG